MRTGAVVRRGSVLACALLCVLSACAATGPVARAAREKQNTAVVLAFLDTVFNKHEVEQAFKLYIGPNYRQHNPYAADGIEGAIGSLSRLTHEQFPELRLEVKRTLAQNDLVAVHARLMANAAERDSGRGHALVDIFRLEHGKIVEHWDVVEEVPEKSANDNTMF